MGIFSFFKKKAEDNSPILVAVLQNSAYSGIYLDILKENNIPYQTKNEGVQGYTKLLFGEYSVPEYVYVMPQYYDRAKEFYEAYMNLRITDYEE